MLRQTYHRSAKTNARPSDRRRHDMRRALLAESLEQRRLLSADLGSGTDAIGDQNLVAHVSELPGTGTAEIQGTKWLDHNGNGIRDLDDGPLAGTVIYLDLNDNGILDVDGAIEPSALTNADGEYSFTGLEAGDYVVREVVPAGFEQTSPRYRPARLFATNTFAAPDQIVELDPLTGDVLNQFPTPGTDVALHGLAFDSATLYYVNFLDDILHELDPNTGAIVDSTSLPSGSYDGAALIDGLVYISDSIASDILVFDPVSNAVVNTLDVDGTNPGLSLQGGLGESSGQLVVTTTTSDLYFVDPMTAAATLAFNHGLTNLDAGATGFDDEIYLGFNSTVTGIRVYSRDGVPQRTLDVGFPAFALGGTGRTFDDAHRVRLDPSQIVSGLDFGNHLIQEDQSVAVVIHSTATFQDKALPGDTVTVSGMFQAVGTLDTLTAIITWDDGMTSQVTINPTDGTFTAEHVYASGGIFDIRLTLGDDDTGMAVGFTTAVVTGVRLSSDGELQVVGTDGRDHVKLKLTSDGGSDGDSDGRQIKVEAKFKSRNRGGSDAGSDGGEDTYLFDPADVTSIRITLCDGNDRAKIDLGGSDGDGDISIPALIEGGDGDDHLTGGSGDDVIIGGRGKDKLNGRDGNDVLIGGDGNDKLQGDDGLDLLFGGLGKDTLKGNKDDDILIGGFTSFDNDLAALAAIRDGWTSGETYEARVANLSGGTNPSLVVGITVHDDGVKDKLKGRNGRDWFFADLAKH